MNKHSHRRGRTGGLLWWTLRDTASSPARLARSALDTRFPAIFLPVPFPVEPKQAFRRALQQTTVKVPESIDGSWRADHMTKLPKVTRPIREWAKSLGKIEGLEFGLLQSWSPESPRRPWLVRIWVALDPSKKVLHMFPAPSTRSDGVREMMARAKRMFEKELRSSTAPEIGDGVVKALEHAGGVKLRAGLWSVPGQDGIKLAKSVRDYLSNVGKSKTGMLILVKSTRSVESDAGSLVEMGLLEEVEDFVREIRDTKLKTIGNGALRTLWDKVENMDEKLRANEELIGSPVDKLRAKLEPARKLLNNAAGHRKVALNRTAGRAAILYLHDGISAVRSSAHNGDLDDLKLAELLLVRGQAAARGAGIALLLGRLRKLTRAAIHVRKKVFFEALEDAAKYVEKQARMPLPPSKHR